MGGSCQLPFEEECSGPLKASPNKCQWRVWDIGEVNLCGATGFLNNRLWPAEPSSNVKCLAWVQSPVDLWSCPVCFSHDLIMKAGAPSNSFQGECVACSKLLVIRVRCCMASQRPGS